MAIELTMSKRNKSPSLSSLQRRLNIGIGRLPSNALLLSFGSESTCSSSDLLELKDWGDIEKVTFERDSDTSLIKSVIQAFPEISEFYCVGDLKSAELATLPIDNLANLKTLDLRRFLFTNAFQLKVNRLRALEHLTLVGTGLESSFVEGLSVESLRSLSLPGFQLPNSVCKSAVVNSLRSIDLSSNCIDDIGVHWLCNGGKHVAIYLDRNNLTDRVFEALGQLPDLMELSLRNTKITEDAAIRFAKDHPKCRTWITAQSKPWRGQIVLNEENWNQDRLDSIVYGPSDLRAE